MTAFSPLGRLTSHPGLKTGLRARFSGPKIEPSWVSAKKTLGTSSGAPKPAEILCFKHTRKVARDNTVKFHWRVLQLLPDRERPSYAGLRVEVLERPYGELIVQYQGHTVATQEPPPRMGTLWAAVSPWSPGPELKRIVSNVGDHHISKSQQRRLAALEPVRIDEATVLTVAGKDVASNALITWGRTPPPTQKARWKAIQQARLNGLSLRAIAKEHGIARDTVRKYDYAEQPPTKKLSAQERTTESATQIRNRRQLTKRNFRFSFNRTESLDNNSPHQRD